MEEEPKAVRANGLRSCLWHSFLTFSMVKRDRLIFSFFFFLFFLSVIVGFSLRYGPVGQAAGEPIPEGERQVDCGREGLWLGGGKLQVHLKRGRNLARGDSILSPFATLEVDGVEKDSGFARFGWRRNARTPVWHSTENPEWNDMRWFCLKQNVTSLRIQVWDYNYFTEKGLVGIAELNVEDVKHHSVLEGVFRWSGTLTLTGPEASGAGQIEVETLFFPVRDLEEIAPSLQTGDVVLFSGATMNGKFIKSSTKSEWSHVGLIWRPPGTDAGSIRIIEASTNHAQLTDCDTGQALWGVEKLGLRDKVFCGFYDVVAVRRLYWPGGEARRLQLHETLDSFYRTQMGKPYEEYKVDMIKAKFDWNSDFGIDSLFCSEFAAFAFVEAGVLSVDKIPSNVMQYEFSSESTKAPIQNGGHLHSEVYISNPQAWGKGRCFEVPSACECGTQGQGYHAWFGCFAPPCGSMYALWWGANVDIGMGLPLEVLFFVVWLCWTTSCLLGNCGVSIRHFVWVSQALKVKPMESQHLGISGLSAEELSAKELSAEEMGLSGRGLSAEEMGLSGQGLSSQVVSAEQLEGEASGAKEQSTEQIGLSG